MLLYCHCQRVFVVADQEKKSNDTHRWSKTGTAFSEHHALKCTRCSLQPTPVVRCCSTKRFQPRQPPKNPNGKHGALLHFFPPCNSTLPTSPALGTSAIQRPPHHRRRPPCPLCPPPPVCLVLRSINRRIIFGTNKTRPTPNTAHWPW